MPHTGEGQGSITPSPASSSVRKYVKTQSLWVPHGSARLGSYKCLACFRQQEICLNPFHSYDFTAQAGKPSGKVANTTVTLFGERGGVSRGGKPSQKVCQCPKCWKSHPTSPRLGTPGAGGGGKALCIWGGFLQGDDPGLFKPKLKGDQLLSRFLTVTQLIPHEFIILLLVLKE